MVSYDFEQNGWRQIYDGILSPFANKYKIYIKSELKNRLRMINEQRKSALTGNKIEP